MPTDTTGTTDVARDVAGMVRQRRLIWAAAVLTAVLLAFSGAPDRTGAAQSGTDDATQQETTSSPDSGSGADETPDTAGVVEGSAIETAGRAGGPVARPDAYTVAQDTTRQVQAPGVLRNDSKGRPIIARFVLGVEYGELTLGKKGGFSYTPDPNFRGVDYFKYKACLRSSPSRCSKAVAVKLTVSGDAPVANSDSFVARKNHRKVIKAPGVLRNDTDANGDEIRVISYTQPGRGGVVVGGGGYVRFVPDRNFTGQTSFRYYVGDGTGLRDSAVATFRVRR